jgi:hypothetical protein
MHKYLGNNLFWFESEADYTAYIKKGGYNGAQLYGNITERRTDGGILAYITADENTSH